MNSSYLFANGLRMHYLRWKREAGDQPVVLLHGLAANARYWEKVAPFLVSRGLAPLALDMRGHGLTDKPEAGYEFDSLHADLIAFMDALTLEKPLLVGHAWGALTVLDYAARQAVGPRSPAGIVLVDGGLYQLDDGPGATWEQVSQKFVPPALDGTPLERFLEMLSSPSSTTGNLWKLSDQDIQIILSNYEVDEEERVSSRLSREHHMHLLKAMWEFKTYERYGRVRCPVFIIPARKYGATGEEAGGDLDLKEKGVARVQGLIRNLRVEWMADTVHDVPLHRSEELANLIADFAASL
ncbi:MAG: alpha/beta hydrolase [Chloroflexota bacterium]|nr:MAG: alpha/beta hydrolase [Chloroflexota bacterium]